MLQSTHGPSTLLSVCKALQHAVSESLVAGGMAAAVQSMQTLLPMAAASSQLQQQRCKHSVRMVLLEDHEKLGRRGDIVKVKSGHARYTLFPQGKADYAIPTVLRKLKALGVLTPEAQQQLREGFTERGAAARIDPATLPPEQQLPEIIQLLSSKSVVVTRRFNRQHPEQPMLGEVTAKHLAAYTAQQLKVELPPELIMMHSHAPITHFGSFKVPLNLRDEQGQQVELEVVVQKTLRSSRVRQLKERLFAQQQQVPKRAAQAAQAGQQQ